MKLILALGNPGERYRDTRHNAGWWLADHLVARWDLPAFRRDGPAAGTGGGVSGQDVRLVKPLTWMNRSGRALRPWGEREDFRPDEDLLVLVDDVALPPGRFRVRASGSAGGHNGLLSVEGALRSRDYARLRIGVGGPGDRDVDLADWVLSPPRPDEEELVLAGFGRAAEAVECWLADGVEEAMNRANRS
ncbi:MAG: aminoacyl-tRNA hydrolase [Gemmatimonadota bacterium]|nr:aminoacyl-tRNA hydrolase [Gemmatimonadota bacterium]